MSPHRSVPTHVIRRLKDQENSTPRGIHYLRPRSMDPHYRVRVAALPARRSIQLPDLPAILRRLRSRLSRGAGPSGPSAARSRLLLMAGLPLLDGVFASGVMSGAISTPLPALSFGVFVFSGPGCWFAASQLQGSVSCRLRTVCRLYLVVALGAVLSIPFAAVIHGLALPDFRFFSGLVLLGVAADLAGFGISPKTAPPNMVTDPRGSWVWHLRCIASPQAVISIALAASVLYDMRSSSVVLASVEQGAFAHFSVFPAFAVLSGFIVTVAGTFLSAGLERWLAPRWTARAGAVVLGVIALIIIGIPLSTPIVLGLIGVGIALALTGNLWERHHAELSKGEVIR